MNCVWNFDKIIYGNLEKLQFFEVPLFDSFDVDSVNKNMKRKIKMFKDM